MGKGLFNTSDSALTLDFKDRPHTTVLLFVTPEQVPESALSLYIERPEGTHGYGAYLQYNGHVILTFRGLTLQSAAVPAGTFCLVVFSYFGDDKIITSVNGTPVVNDAPQFPYIHNPQRFILGGSENTAASRFVAARRFDFAMDEEQIALLYNGCHPELWHVPDVWRNVPTSKWPTGNWLEASGTWGRNYSEIITSANLSTANGFSDAYARFERGTAEALSLSNSFRNSNDDERACYQLIEFEYRSNVLIQARSGSETYEDFPANTDDAVTVSYVTPAGKYTAITQVGNDADAWLEIRTLCIVSVGTVLDLTPAGLTSTLWRDTSGQGNDVPYVPAEGQSASAELSYATDGFPATTADDRDALIACANHYTALREQLLLTEAAEAAARDDAALRTYVDEVGNTALDAATDYADRVAATALDDAKKYADDLAAGKEDAIPTITITDFDTFNPSTCTETKNLADGEFVRFTSHDAVGQPDATYSTAARIWAGRITRLRSGYYRLEALGGASSTHSPQTYSRIYTIGTAREWLAGSESLNTSTNGYVKFPSGLMIQWGKFAYMTGDQTSPVTITFPKPFVITPFSISLTPFTGDANPAIWSLVIRSYSASQMTVMTNKLSSTGSVGFEECHFYWMATGMAE